MDGHAAQTVYGIWPAPAPRITKSDTQDFASKFLGSGQCTSLRLCVLQYNVATALINMPQITSSTQSLQCPLLRVARFGLKTIAFVD